MIAVDAGSGLHVCLKDFGGSLRGNLPNSADVGLRKLQFGRIDKACLDESAGLANTFAVIFGIDEAAVVAQIFVEIFARAGENLAEVGGGEIDDLGADLITDLEDFAEDEDKTLAAIQAQECSDHAVIFCFFDEDFNGNGHGAGSGGSRSGTWRNPAEATEKEQIGISYGPLGLFDID